MSALTWPVFLLDGHDVIVVADASVVQRELEPFLSDEPVEFYDAVARPVRLIVEWERRRVPFLRRPRMHLEVVSEEAQGQRLRSALTRYLQASDRNVPDHDDLLVFTTTAADRLRPR